jgi:hypothetical protein
MLNLDEEKSMLIENQNNKNEAFKINDTVIVSATGQTGRITAYEGGRWKVLIAGNELLKESHEIEKRQMLFG